MLIRFVVGNFMSFKEETEFNMLSGKGRGYKQHQNHVKSTNSGVDVLKTAAIYGANASGKSNFINAIEYLRDLIVEDEDEFVMPQSKRFRLDDSYRTKPTTFRLEYEFKEYHFDYGLEIEKGEVKEEWLYLINSVKQQKDTLLFSRSKMDVSFGDSFSSSDLSYVKTYLKKELRRNQSAVNAVNDNIENNNIIDVFYESMCSLIVVKPEMYNTRYTSQILSSLTSKDYVEGILRKSNTGINELVLKEIPADTFFSYEEEDLKQGLIDELESGNERSENDEKTFVYFHKRNFHNVFSKKGEKYFVSVLKTKHINSENLFDLSEESDGTNRLFELSPVFEDLTGKEEVVYLIDELERSLHPILAKELLKLYSLNSNSKSQLIFTTHESNLLDLELLRQDEIWFAEKKIDGSSIFYPLSDFKPREDKNIRLGYLEGRYGGIPFLGDFSKLI